MTEELTKILADVSNFIGNAFTWMGDALGTVTSEPVLFIFVVAVPLVGLGVGLLKRLIRV